MQPVSIAPVLIEEDLRLTVYRLEVARDMPKDPYRDALIAGLASRLNNLSQEPGVFDTSRDRLVKTLTPRDHRRLSFLG